MAEPLEPTDIDRLAELVGELAGQKLCVVGDAMLDRWITGVIERVSPEVPVPVVEEHSVIELPGGAANVARTAAALGARTTLVAMVGTDPEADRLKALCVQAGITPHLVTDPERPTSVKTRVGDGRHTVVRFDREQTDRASGDTTRALIEALREAIPQADAVVVSDYAKGVIAPEVFAAICEVAGNRPILVDPKASNPALYHGARWLSPNRKQAERWAGRKLESTDDYEDVAAKIRDATGADGVFLTLGSEGIWVAPQRGEQSRRPARARLVFDVTGAGDTCAAILALALAVEATPREAAELANAAAGVVVGIPQTGVITPKELRSAVVSRPGGVICPLDVLERALHTHRERGERIVLTNGCFDLLHAGHIALLAACRREGDIVVVAINSDASVRGLKGPGRPLTPERDRAVVIAALADVDYVVLFDQATPAQLIDRLRPDVLVKGSDWAAKGVVGRETVEAGGGRVMLVDLIPDRSTTRLIEELRGADTMPAEDPA